MNKENPIPSIDRPQMAACFEIDSGNAMGIEICITRDEEIIIYQYTSITSKEGLTRDSISDDEHIRDTPSDDGMAAYSWFMTFHNPNDFIARMRLALDTFEKVSEIEWPDSGL